jgi:hypothetical protein
MKGGNTFWVMGYVGMVNSIPYYSSKVNARQAVALRVLVDYFSFAVENTQSLPPNHHWPKAVMNKTSPTIENFVVLCENNEYESSHGKYQTEDHLFCILLKDSTRFTLLIPRGRDYRPWKEIDFKAGNWSGKWGASAIKST